MIKRLSWFLGGVAAGVVGVGAAKKKVKSVAHELAPVQVAKRARSSIRERRNRVADAVREGRRAMRARELELRARLDGRTSSLADELHDVDEVEAVLVDGQPVEPGRVIVLREVREQQRRPRRRAQ